MEILKKYKYSSFLALFLIAGVLSTTLFFTKKAESIRPRHVSPLAKSFSVNSLLDKNHEKPNKIIYGYLPYWNLNQIKHLQLDKLTDVSYFGLRINADGTFRKLDNSWELEPGYNHWKNSEVLRDFIATAKESGTRISLTVISHQDDISTQFLTCESCWKTFVDELKNELKDKEIKDVNLNFEYVEYVDEDIADQYTKFVSYVNKELDAEFGDSFVVVASFADSLVKPRITKIPEISEVADAIFIMAYDFHAFLSETSGPVSPIGGAGKHTNYDINTMLNDYLAVVPSKKIIMGVPYYGYNWLVTETTKYAPTVMGYSVSQPYASIVDDILEEKPDIQWDTDALTPYYFYFDSDEGMYRQVFYENEASLKIKYGLVKNLDLAGVGIWALGYDQGYMNLWNLIDLEFF